MTVLSPVYAFGILFEDFAKRLRGCEAKAEDIDKLYRLSSRVKIDLFLSKNISRALFASDFSSEFIEIVCVVLGLENTVSRARVVARNIGRKVMEVVHKVVGSKKAVPREAPVVTKTADPAGTSWLNASEAGAEVLIGGDEEEVGIVDPRDLGSGKSAAQALPSDDDMGHAKTTIAPLDLDDTLRKGKED
jgi:hypothetical protein